MATVIDAKEWVFQRLRTAKVGGEITINGEIYIDKKVFEDKEDIVVNSITADNDSFQTILINVNCYVPDLHISAEGKSIYMPNRKRLSEVSTQVYKVLNDYTEKQLYRFYIESSRQEEEQTENSHFMNFRVRVIAKNY